MIEVIRRQTQQHGDAPRRRGHRHHQDDGHARTQSNAPVTIDDSPHLLEHAPIVHPPRPAKKFAAVSACEHG